MTDQSDLIAWLRQQLDEDERRIIAYRDGHAGPCINYAGQDPAAYDEYDSCHLHIQAAEATPYRDVRFGLAEVAAKRAHIARWEDVNRMLAEDETPGPIRNELLSVRRAYALVIADDAQPYADREGYREEWRQ